MTVTSPAPSATLVLPGAPDPNLQQGRAANPDDMVWVGASAGSGKTTVLTSRVLRLLLPDPQGRYPGTPAHRLLCITYTKAAAAEMSLRVQKHLSDWAVIPEGDLFKRLSELTGHDPGPDMISAARKLFADVLEAPGGLKLMTIHSFCQSVLGRFPLEAGVVPGFTVLDEAQTRDLFTGALEDSLITAQLQEEGDLSRAFRLLSPYLQLDDLRQAIRQVLRHPERLEQAPAGLDELKAWIQEAYNLPAGQSAQDVRRAFVAATPEAELRGILPVMKKAGKITLDIATGMQAWLDQNEQDRLLHLLAYQSILLTDKDKPRSLRTFPEKDPETAALVAAEMQRMLTLLDQINLHLQTRLTSSLMFLSRAVQTSFEARKARLGALDYDDLIRKTDDLLGRTSGQWVHYKLDGGIDHLLMDEAQDTNPRQWNIMRNLSAEMFDGQGRDSERPRSVFVVGDEKQSIFSFQGADPKVFDKMRSWFRDRSLAAERPFEEVPLEVSFRTTPPVLALVDAVFADPDLKARIGLRPAQELRHFSQRRTDAGLIEIWPLLEKPETAKSDSWELPFIQQAVSGAGGSLAEQIAQEIWGWIQRRDILPAYGRPVEAGDILILVRNRSALVNELIRQLKRRGLPVSGIDRLILSDQIGVQDLMALARFSRLPDDDFSLACILRSPLAGVSEEVLMGLALGRGSQTLWQAIQARGDEALRDWLEGLITLARSAAPFEFFETILARPCPADAQGSGWRAMTARLGTDVIDPLEELMSLCLRLEDQGIRTLESLLLWQQKTKVEVKREMEEAAGQIRIMTVHASKGLEAPIVILPDTTSVPQRGRTDSFLWPQSSDLPAPLWTPSGAYESSRFAQARDRLLEDQQAEYARLLYVALTRARDRLYVMGMAGSARQANATWHAAIRQGFAQLDGVETLENGRLRLVSAQTGATRTRAEKARSSEAPALPSWLETLPQREAPMVIPFAPSRGDAELLPVQSPLDPEQPHRFRRGTLTHKLLQVLPDLPDAAREQAARVFVMKNGADLPDDVQVSIVAETLTVLRDPRFAPVFGPGSLAEVPVTGRLQDGRLISGQIDRLVVTGDEILIVDFKTNRPSPDDPAQIPQIYLDQLRNYRDAIALIYPNLLINCALLWTDQPRLMPVTI